jgi:UbiD family decarboxylase
MEEHARQQSGSLNDSEPAKPVAWRDLREWLSLIDAKGMLKRIHKAVDPDEELAAIALMATRQEDAPALKSYNLAGDRSGASVLVNMLGSSKERYALAVGLDPALSIADMSGRAARSCADASRRRACRSRPRV